MKPIIISLLKNDRLQLWLFTFALILPNIVMAFTEPLPWYTNVMQLLFATGFFGTLMFCGLQPGRQFYRLFLFVFFAAFQLVLLWLYGNSPISVDMFLNLVSTNANEAGELLGNIIAGVIIFCTFYIVVLIFAASSWRYYARHRRDTALDTRYTAYRHRLRRLFILPLFVTTTAVCTILNFTTPFRFSADVYPINVTFNMGMAVYRYFQLMRYDSASANFAFNATPTHPADEQETYVMIIGETARSLNFSIYGYERPTTPRLAARQGLHVFRNVLSQSNTTHKSVPLLLTAAEAATPDPMYTQKSLIAAFREAGFHTIYISNQADNGSLTDHYSREAHVRRYVRTPDRMPDDADLITTLRDELTADTHTKRLILLHTYGSHFKYCERVPAEYRRFTPCEDKQLKAANREDLINAFDNTILYADMVIDSIMTVAGALPADTSRSHSLMVAYVSDHGEDIYDDERSNFLHASPIVSFYQMAVPFVIWTNRDYRTAHPSENSMLTCNERAEVSPARDLFHTMLGAAGIRTTSYTPSHSLTDPQYHPSPRLFLNDRNEPCTLHQLHLTPHDFQLMRKFGITY